MARGRWIELATAREEPICGGTLAYLDATLGAAFEFIGETPPDGVFVRYEWLEKAEEFSLGGTGATYQRGENILIQSDQLVLVHELVHAATSTAWPRTARFLSEGLAVLLDSSRVFDRYPWPAQLAIDDVIGGPIGPGGKNYRESWFIVSQIVRDHGVDGLRALWHAVPRGATAQEIRDAYQSLFNQPIEALFEPISAPYGIAEAAPEERIPCVISLCPDEPVVYTGKPLLVPSPWACEDDPNAVGPYDGGPIDGSPVYRSNTIETDRLLFQSKADTLTTVNHACFLQCMLLEGSVFEFPGGGPRFGLGPGRWRNEARAEVDDLPTDNPERVEFTENLPMD